MTQPLPKRKPIASAARSGPLLSVVITTYTLDRLIDVRQALDSLKAQSYPHMEIIFVGERLPELCDHVTAYAQEQAIANIKTLFNDGPPGLSPARNLGIDHAEGNIVAFLDDDAIAFPDWAEQIVEAFAADDERVAITGPVYPAWEEESMSWFPEEFLWIFSCTMPSKFMPDGPHKVRNAWGVNMSFRSEVFQYCRFSETFVGGNQGSTDGSKQGLVGDDTEFCLQINARMGRPVIFCPAVRVYHKVYRHRLTSRFIHRRAFWEGYTKAVLAKQYAGRTGQKLVLSSEYSLLRHILFRFFPRTFYQLPRNPVLAGRRLLVARDVLLHVALGYTVPRLPGIGTIITNHYRR